MFIVCCKNSFKTFIKKMPKKLRSEAHHVSHREWDEFIAKVPVAVTLSMKQKDDVDFENKDSKKVKERCD
jgi:hypothetical protein